MARQQEEAQKELTDEARKAAHRRFQDLVLALSKAFALASASDEAKAIRDEVAFYQTVRAALVKSSGVTKSKKDRELAI